MVEKTGNRNKDRKYSWSLLHRITCSWVYWSNDDSQYYIQSNHCCCPASTSSSTPVPNPTPAPVAPTPEEVTISQLYGSSVAKGTMVKVTGIVSQSDGYNLRLRNSDYQDILVQGSDLSAYEGQSVTVIGKFEGPTSYVTVMGGERTVPTIKNARLA